jgi:SRSO17 transposase
MAATISDARIERYFDEVIGPELGRKSRRVSFSAYALGLLGTGERKSCEPIAARMAGGTTTEARSGDAGRAHDRLLSFLAYSPWDDEAVRLAGARYAIEEFEKHEAVTTWIIDDTGFPKQGKESVGVQRQYSGTLGKTGNCQIAVSLSVATRSEQLPIDFQLYLPKVWMDDPARREKVGIPESAIFRTKIAMAVEMIARAKRNGIPGDIVLADAAYGMAVEFREGIRSEGMDFGVAVQSTTRVWRLDPKGRLQDDPIRVDNFAEALGRSAFRRVTWREGTKGKMSSSFCLRRVKVEQDDGLVANDRETVWLVMEWPDGDDKPGQFHLTTLPRRQSHKQVVRVLKERWRTEQAYQEMKGELGLDHFEGRSFRGWHHHISAVLACYALVVAERRRLFPPAQDTTRSRSLRRQPGAPLRRLLRDHPPRHRHGHAPLATALPDLFRSDGP